MAKNSPAISGDPGDASLILGSERAPGKGNGNPLQYSCLENPMDRGVGYSPWGHKESDMTERLSTHTHTHTHTHTPTIVWST